jgi:preprotein translocase subunit YajC
MLGGGRKIPLCRRGSGFDAVGLDYLIKKRTEYYARRRRDRTLMKGDRVAVLGRGIAVVEQADDKDVSVVLGNKLPLKIARREIRWNPQNLRWEARGRLRRAPSDIWDLSP